MKNCVNHWGHSRAQLVNLDAGFVQEKDGTISHHDLYDYLHLTQKGYDRAFEPVNELLSQLLSEFESDSVRTEAEGSADWIHQKQSLHLMEPSAFILYVLLNSDG